MGLFYPAECSSFIFLAGSYFSCCFVKYFRIQNHQTSPEIILSVDLARACFTEYMVWPFDKDELFVCSFVFIALGPQDFSYRLGNRCLFSRPLTLLSFVALLLAVVISSYILACRCFPSCTLAVTKLYGGISQIFYCPGNVYKGLRNLPKIV